RTLLGGRGPGAPTGVDDDALSVAGPLVGGLVVEANAYRVGAVGQGGAGGDVGNAAGQGAGGVVLFPGIGEIAVVIRVDVQASGAAVGEAVGVAAGARDHEAVRVDVGRCGQGDGGGRGIESEGQGGGIDSVVIMIHEAGDDAAVGAVAGIGWGIGVNAASV